MGVGQDVISQGAGVGNEFAGLLTGGAAVGVVGLAGFFIKLRLADNIPQNYAGIRLRGGRAFHKWWKKGEAYSDKPLGAGVHSKVPIITGSFAAISLRDHTGELGVTFHRTMGQEKVQLQAQAQMTWGVNCDMAESPKDDALSRRQVKKLKKESDHEKVKNLTEALFATEDEATLTERVKGICMTGLRVALQTMDESEVMTCSEVTEIVDPLCPKLDDYGVELRELQVLWVAKTAAQVLRGSGSMPSLPAEVAASFAGVPELGISPTPNGSH